MIMHGQWLKPLTKCRSRKGEAALPSGAAPNASLRYLDLAGLRRGLARGLVMEHRLLVLDEGKLL
jgi:hypothetical protein